MKRRRVPSIRVLLAVGVGLVAFENVVAVITGGELFASGARALLITAVLVTATVATATLSGMGPDEVGVVRRHAGPAAMVGLGLGVLAAAAVVAMLEFTPTSAGPVRYSPLAALTWGDVVLRALVWMPLTTALPEELAFRGVLLGLLLRRYSDSRAALVAALPFALWHGLIVVHTVGQTSLALSPVGWGLGIGGGFVVVAFGGWLFAQLRLRSGTLVAPFFCHWFFNATVLLGLYALQR